MDEFEVFMTWCNANTGFLSALFALLSFVTTLVYVIATVSILKANQKSAKMAETQINDSKIALQKTIDMQLYEKRLAVACNIEKNDYSNTLMETSLLFNLEISKKVAVLKDLTHKKIDWNAKLKEYYRLLEQEYPEYFELELKTSVEQPDYELVLDFERLQKRCNAIQNPFVGNNEYEMDFYVRDEIEGTLSKLTESINTKQSELKNAVWHMIRQSISGIDNLEIAVKEVE